MAFAKCAKNIRYISVPWYKLSCSKATYGGSSRCLAVHSFVPVRMLVRASFDKLIPTCGFLRHLCVLAIDLQLLHKIIPSFCSSRDPVRCRDPPMYIKVLLKL